MSIKQLLHFEHKQTSLIYSVKFTEPNNAIYKMKHPSFEAPIHGLQTGSQFNFLFNHN